jgi:6,7-dimethyl-8-ribityllumazine synthase
VARNYDVDAILVIAILVQREAGNPIHFESAAQAVSQGIMQVQLSTNVPVLCGVLSCLSDEQVLSYISDPDDVPRSLALSTMQMAEMKRFDFQDDITCG